MNRKELISYLLKVLEHYENTEHLINATYHEGYNDGLCTAYSEIIEILEDCTDF